ncbi:MAG TPA: hypothetical protein VJP77_02525, partial [Planctomycetota bacterium]|nr:hypothetical protein [Planctomycetota bacterium]
RWIKICLFVFYFFIIFIFLLFLFFQLILALIFQLINFGALFWDIPMDFDFFLPCFGFKGSISTHRDLGLSAVKSEKFEKSENALDMTNFGAVFGIC